MTLLAIDISSESIRLLLLKRSKKGYSIRGYATEHLPTGTINQQRLNATQAFGTALQAALKRLPPTIAFNRNAIMALSWNQVMTKIVPLVSGLSHTEMHSHLQQIIANLAATASSEVFWDYAILSVDENTVSAETLVVIAQQAAVLAYQDVLAANRLALQVVDVECYALARAWRACYKEQPHSAKTYAIILLRRELITCVVLTDTSVCYARAAPLENAENYTVSVAHTTLQLIKNMGLATENLELFLAGEYASTQNAIFLGQQLHLSVQLVQCHNLQWQEETEPFNFPHYFLSFGLALWELEK